MRFLVQSDISLDVPPELLAQLVERTRTHVGAARPGVSVECVYGILGGRGAVAICDAPDGETLHSVLTDAPLFHFERFTVTPLVAFDAFLDGMLNAARAAGEAA